MTKLIVDAAAAFGRRVARESAAADRRCAIVVDAAAHDGGRIARDGGAGDRQRARVKVLDAAAADGGRVARDRGVGDRQCAEFTLAMPPPAMPAELPEMVQLVTVIVPSFLMPPPRSGSG